MKRIPPVTLLYGNQQLALDEEVQKILTILVPEAEQRELCLERYAVSEAVKGGDADSVLSDLTMSLEALPFLQERKIVRLDQAELIKATKGKASSSTARLLQSIQQFAQAPLAGVWLILCSSAMRESDLSKPLLAACKKAGRVAKFVAYDNDQPVEWVRQRAQQKGLQLRGATPQLLIEMVGNDLADLEQELEKLSLLLGSRAQVEEATLQQHVQGHKHFSVFALSESAARKDLRGALATLEQQLRENPRETVKLYGLLTAQFRRLLQIHYGWQQSLPEQEILSRLRLHPFIGKQVLRNARQFSVEELERILIHLADLDLAVKFHQQHAKPLLQDLLQQISQGAFRNA